MISRSFSLTLSLLVGIAVVGSEGCGGSNKGTGATDGSLPASTGGSTTAPPAAGSLGSDAVGPAGAGGGTPAQGGGGITGSGGAGLPGTDAGATGGGGGSTAPSCGQPGMQCCDGNSCSGGGCCVSQICMAVGGTCVGLGGGVCNAGACGSCGGPGLPCCGSNPATGVCTSPGTSCNAGNCTQCGGLGQPCCSSSGGAGKCTAANAICGAGNVCLACGVPGSACCPGNLCDSPGCCYGGTCAGQGSGCGTAGGTCQAGRCSGCGSASQPCCSDQCYDGLLCKSGTCNPCGGLGQICCSGSTGTAACQTGSACSSDGTCARCGGLGDICCADNGCSGGCCSGGRCLAPGTGDCPGSPPDSGSQPDVPGSGGGGAGGQGGAGGVSGTGLGGAGGSTAASGGAGGSTVPSGGAGGSTAASGGAGGSTWAPPTGCGDHVVTFPEQCDDGNTVPFDGCSSDCQNEPVCNGVGPCTSRCGDGLVIDEECDDGNTADGDGCSSACKVEPGFTCSQPPLGDSILVPVVYRDFRFHNPTDFEPGVSGQETASPGMVQSALDTDGKPVFAGITGSGVHVAGTDSFASWYRDTPDVNHATASKLPMWSNGSGAYVNRYGADGAQWPMTETALFCGVVGSETVDSNGAPIECTYKYGTTDCDKLAAKGETMLQCITSSSSGYQGIFLVSKVDGTPVFFPVDDDSFTPASERLAAQIPPLYANGSTTWAYDVDAAGNKIMHNFSFTSEIRYWFKYDASQSYQLDIVGDDDVWVFINKQLAVDLGGIHTPVQGSITLDSTAATKFGLVDGAVYEAAVFQAERQSTSSTFKITLSGFNTAPSQCHAN